MISIFYINILLYIVNTIYMHCIMHIYRNIEIICIMYIYRVVCVADGAYASLKTFTNRP